MVEPRLIEIGAEQPVASRLRGDAAQQIEKRQAPQPVPNVVGIGRGQILLASSADQAGEPGKVFLALVRRRLFGHALPNLLHGLRWRSASGWRRQGWWR